MLSFIHAETWPAQRVRGPCCPCCGMVVPQAVLDAWHPPTRWGYILAYGGRGRIRKLEDITPEAYQAHEPSTADRLLAMLTGAADDLARRGLFDGRPLPGARGWFERHAATLAAAARKKKRAEGLDEFLRMAMAMVSGNPRAALVADPSTSA